MTKPQFSITPPFELVGQLKNTALLGSIGQYDYESRLVMAAYAAGADQELEACVDIVCDTVGNHSAQCLRARRRPKLPTLKEQAMKQLIAMEQNGALGCNVDTIRRALEALPDDN